MANLKKQCTQCGKSFEATTQFFHRNRQYKDGLLSRCKGCQNEKTAEYRAGDGKNYWYDENGGGWFRKNKKKWKEYIKENYHAHFNCKIYAITNPEGKVYIGMTQYPTIGIRMRVHKADFKMCDAGRSVKNPIPLLYDSFKKYGYQNHTAILIEEMDTDDRELGLQRESEYIKQYMNKGISLNKKN